MDYKELRENIVRLKKTLEKMIEKTRKPTKTRNSDTIDDRLNDQGINTNEN